MLAAYGGEREQARGLRWGSVSKLAAYVGERELGRGLRWGA